MTRPKILIKLETTLPINIFQLRLKEPSANLKYRLNILPFYTDGEKFVGEFKKVNITSGEPEIISNVTAPRSTKRIDVSLSTFANLAQLTTDEQDIPKTEIRRPALQFEPVLNFDIGNIRLGILNGFQDAKRYIKSVDGAKWHS